jgi:hypothetical protein
MLTRGCTLNLLYLLKNQQQMNNLCQLALQKGGSVNYLTLPANMTEGLGLNQSFYSYP